MTIPLPRRCASLTVGVMVRRSLQLALLGVAALVCVGPARAQGDDAVARSNALFEDGKRLLTEGKVAEACDKLAASNQLVARGGTLLNLGLCHEQQGKLVAARRELKDALAVAKRDARGDRIPLATEHLASVEAKLSWIKIVPPANVAEDKLEIRLDDAPIARRDWATVPVEAGKHVLVASASGYRPGELVVNIPEGGPQKATAQLDPLAPVAAGTAAAVPPKPDDTTRAPQTTAQIGTASDSKTLRTAALIVGISGFVVSLATGAWALERKGVVRGHCNADKQCDPQGSDAVSLGRTLVITSTAAFAVGAIGVGTWLVLPSGAAPQGSAASAGVTVGGVF